MKCSDLKLRYKISSFFVNFKMVLEHNFIHFEYGHIGQKDIRSSTLMLTTLSPENAFRKLLKP